MIVTTTPSVEGRRIKEYLGVVAGEAVVGAEVIAGIRGLIAGRSGSSDRELRKARDFALAELRLSATELRANAVVGVDLDYETGGGEWNVLLVSASGTAVVVE